MSLPEWTRNNLKPIPFDRDKIMALAEALARDTHQNITHRDKHGVLLGDKEIKVRLEERIRRAREYAAWRIGAYERGECRSPW